MKAYNLEELDAAYVWHPYSPLKQFQKIVALKGARGAELYACNGNIYIDAISSWWTNLHGHAHPYIAQKLFEQALELEHVIFAGFTHQPAVSLAERLIKTIDLNQAKVFFSDNGSTAIEVALKMAIQFWYNKGFAKQTFIAFEEAYHGDTFGAMSVSARGLFTAPFDAHLFRVHFIPTPDGTGRCLQELKRLSGTAEWNSIAGFIYEPLLQGTAGMRIYHQAEMHEILQWLRKHEVLLIADEVFTGFYRTGTMLASHQLHISPDLICLSKGLTAGFMPLGITMCNDLVAEAFLTDDRAKSFFHGHSYTGNPLACAVANASLDLLLLPQTKDNIDNLNKQHSRFIQSLQTFAKARAPRVIGTVAAVDFIPDQQKHGYISEWRDKMYDFFMQRGVLLRPLGTTIYTVPPYCISAEQMQKVYAAITEWFETN
jgi:adenosylmethionine-8-amino-7-oxononanoate aminotransferase